MRGAGQRQREKTIGLSSRHLLGLLVGKLLDVVQDFKFRCVGKSGNYSAGFVKAVCSVGGQVRRFAVVEYTP